MPPKPNIFHGRQTELTSILLSIQEGLEGSKPARVAIRGDGGLGKTSLALSVLHHEETKSQLKDQIYFVSCEATHTPSLLINAINRTLKIPQSGDD
jgi:Cdc6-like AAA superfamily ATPase